MVISRDDLLRLGGVFQPTDLALWPLPGQEAFAGDWLAPWTSGYGLELADSAEIRRLSLSIFDKSFAVTYALEAAAVSYTHLDVYKRQPFRLIGIDVFSAAAVMPRLLPRRDEQAAAGSIFDGGVYASRALLDKLGLPAGAAVRLVRGDHEWSTTIAGDLPAVGPDELLLVADIAWVQDRFGPVGAVSEGRVRLAPNTDLASWRAALAASYARGERDPVCLLYTSRCV